MAFQKSPGYGAPISLQKFKRFKAKGIETGAFWFVLAK
jgi:hypothetical protein